MPTNYTKTLTGAKDPLVCYAVVDRSLSSIQKGIQAAHAIVELAVGYWDSQMFRQWSTQDRTIILLDAPEGMDIEEFWFHLADFELRSGMVPTSIFAEDETWNYMLTACAFILPKTVKDNSPNPFCEMLRDMKLSMPESLG